MYHRDDIHKMIALAVLNYKEHQSRKFLNNNNIPKTHYEIR